jgi:endo-alpha-1,4-polygalactosaminidase (GH114 family)
MMELMLAKLDSFREEIKTNQSKADADVEEMKEEMLAKMEARIKANNEKFEVLPDTLISLMDAHYARTEANQEMIAKLDTHHERMRASVNAWQEEMTACQEATEAYPE